MPLVSVVVPVYFNEGSLVELKDRLAAVAVEFSDRHTFEFVFVDDGSGDRSFEVLSRLAAEDARVRVLRLSRNFGSNAAILAGMTAAMGDSVGCISADLQDPPELIAQMVTAWEGGAETVMAVRRSRNDPLASRLPAQVFNYLFHRFAFRDFPSTGYDCVLLDRRVVDVLVRHKERNAFIFGQIAWLGFRRHLIEYDRVARKSGKSRWTFSRKLKYFIDATAAFSYLPLRCASVAGIGLALLGVLYAIVVIVLKAFVGFDAIGWASLVVIVLVLAGAQLTMLGIMGEYLWRVLDECRGRPVFIVAEGCNLPPAQLTRIVPGVPLDGPAVPAGNRPHPKAAPPSREPGSNQTSAG